MILKYDIENLFNEVNKCTYCGFCEPVCPTLPLGPHRGYGPRGRINLIKEIIISKTLSEESIASIYSCLICNACSMACPAGIDIGRSVREMKFLIRKEFLGKNKVPIIIKER